VSKEPLFRRLDERERLNSLETASTSVIGSGSAGPVLSIRRFCLCCQPVSEWNCTASVSASVIREPSLHLCLLGPLRIRDLTETL
jgi:hypothetical protein